MHSTPVRTADPFESHATTVGNAQAGEGLRAQAARG
jgi:hypothetical protein